MNVDEVEMGNLEMRCFLLFSPFTEPILGRRGGGWELINCSQRRLIRLGKQPIGFLVSSDAVVSHICWRLVCSVLSGWSGWSGWSGCKEPKGPTSPLGQPHAARVVPRAALSRVHESGLHLRLRLQTATATATCNLHTAHCTRIRIRPRAQFKQPRPFNIPGPHRRIAALLLRGATTPQVYLTYIWTPLGSGARFQTAQQPRQQGRRDRANPARSIHRPSLLLLPAGRDTWTPSAREASDLAWTALVWTRLRCIV